MDTDETEDEAARRRLGKVLCLEQQEKFGLVKFWIIIHFTRIKNKCDLQDANKVKKKWFCIVIIFFLLCCVIWLVDNHKDSNSANLSELPEESRAELSSACENNMESEEDTDQEKPEKN